MASCSFCPVDSAVDVFPGAHKAKANARRPILKFMRSSPSYPTDGGRLLLQELPSRSGMCPKTIQPVNGFSPFVAEEDYEVSKQNAKHAKLNPSMVLPPSNFVASASAAP